MDAHNDVAMLYIKSCGETLPVAFIGQSASLQRGEPVVAIGSPYGYENSVAQGIVSTVARLTQPPNKERGCYIQHDATNAMGGSGELFIHLLIDLLFLSIYSYILFKFIHQFLSIY